MGEGLPNLNGLIAGKILLPDGVIDLTIATTDHSSLLDSVVSYGPPSVSWRISADDQDTFSRRGPDAQIL